MSAPPSAAEVETMEICRKVQEQDISEVATVENSDNSLEAFLDVEAMGDDDEDAIAGSSQQQNLHVESTAPQHEQESSSATESADMLPTQII